MFIDEAKKTFDATDDKLTKSSGGKVETLGEEDDVEDVVNVVKGRKGMGGD